MPRNKKLNKNQENINLSTAYGNLPYEKSNIHVENHLNLHHLP